MPGVLNAGEWDGNPIVSLGACRGYVQLYVPWYFRADIGDLCLFRRPTKLLSAWRFYDFTGPWGWGSLLASTVMGTWMVSQSLASDILPPC